MIREIIAGGMATAAIACLLMMIFSRTRGVLCSASLGLSLSLGFLIFLLADVRAGFWTLASFLILDSTLIYLAFAVEIRDVKVRVALISRRLRIGLVMILAGVFVIHAVLNDLRQMAVSDQVWGQALRTNSLWSDFWPIALLAALLAAPIFIGSILLLRVEKDSQ